MDSDTFDEVSELVEEVMKAWHRHEGVALLDRQDKDGLDALNKKYQAFLDWIEAVREMADDEE